MRERARRVDSNFFGKPWCTADFYLMCARDMETVRSSVAASDVDGTVPHRRPRTCEAHPRCGLCVIWMAPVLSAGRQNPLKSSAACPQHAC